MFKKLMVVFCIIKYSFCLHTIQNVTEMENFYYDVKTGQPFCRAVMPNKRQSAEKIIFRRVPCSCGNLSCSCCAGIHLSNLNFDRTICTKFIYEPLDFAIAMEVTMNNKEIYSRKFSAKNPPAFCVPVPYIPIVDFCVRFYNVFTPGQNLHACIDFETRVARAPVLILHFDCIRMGVDGIVWLKPEDQGGLSSSASNTDYDEVDFEADTAFFALCSNVTYLISENEQNVNDVVGQLKE